jgi:hypothetical protein
VIREEYPEGNDKCETYKDVEVTPAYCSNRYGFPIRIICGILTENEEARKGKKMYASNGSS